MVFIQILIIDNYPRIQLLFQHTPSVDKHLTAVVTKSSLWLLSSSYGEGWHFNLRVWLSQCGGQYLPHPHGSTCEGRTLAHRNVWFTPSHIQLNDKSNEKKVQTNICCYVSNRHAARPCCFSDFACGLRSAGSQWGFVWWTNSFIQGFACFWLIVSSSLWQDSELLGM